MIGYTIEGFSALLGASSRTVSLWERGKCTPSTRMCIKLAMVFCVTLDELLEVETNPMDEVFVRLGVIVEGKMNDNRLIVLHELLNILEPANK